MRCCGVHALFGIRIAAPPAPVHIESTFEPRILDDRSLSRFRLQSRAMKPIIRPFRQQDTDKLAALWYESWRSTGIQASSQVRPAELRHRVSLELSDGWDVTVAEYEGDLLGFLALRPANRCLDQLFIAPHAKRLGIGRELFGLAKRVMPQGFWLRTAAENRDARAFYEAVGMKLVRIEPHPKHGHKTAIYVTVDFGVA
jgi:GNAT superfamily N-acetyltransferase